MLQVQFENIQKHPLWLVEPIYRIGTASNCDIRLDHPGAPDVAATLSIEGDRVTVEPQAGFADLWLNDAAVSGPTTVGHGDKLTCGPLQLVFLDPKQQKAVTADADTGWQLQPLNSALSRRTFPLTGTKVLGRAKDCDICLGVAHLSRRHAELKVTEHGLEVTDLNSSNGTRVNGEKVSRAKLAHGDELSFDTLRFRVQGPQQAAGRNGNDDTDIDKTTVRAAITQEQVARQKLSAAKPNGPARRPARAPDAPHSPVSQSSTEETSSGNGGLLTGIALGLLLAGGGLAWWWLGR